MSLNWHSCFIVRVLFLCYSLIKEVLYMFNIYDYIKSNERLKQLDFLTVYLTIVELCKDDKLARDKDV